MQIVIRILASLMFSLGLAAPGPTAAQTEPVTVLAAGDIALCRAPWWHKMANHIGDGYPESRAAETADLLDRLDGTVLALGDLVYYEDTVESYRACYDATWGRHRERTRPVPGNHDYEDDGAAYYGYWGARGGPDGRGYYSFELGAWHLVALNSNIDMGPDSEQGRWLRADLAKTRAQCILAFWHHPLFTSSRYRADDRAAPLYRMLHEAGASVVLSGHGHNYERFAPQDADGRPDPLRGLRSFVVGTGGAHLRGLVAPEANSEVFDAETWGVLKLTLREGGYDWRFIPVEGGSFSDSGTAPCVARNLAK